MNSFPQEKNSFFEVVACIALVIALSMTVACGVADAKSQSATESYSVDINSSRTVVHTHSGYVQGVVQGNLLVFRGIPYAAPPVGNLRWRPPQPPATWPGVRDASSFGNVCPQINDNNQLVGNEDCLIVVTAEYRLGLLGFFANALLTSEDGLSSGNYGLLDQIAVLTWVKRNIEAFGGDPAHVMLFGQSAGSNDVQALLVAPPAQGLFSVAAMESGYIPGGFLHTLAQLETLDEPIVSLLGCGSATDVLACLRAVPAGVIVSNQSAVPFRRPVIEPRVIPVDPFVALQQRGSPVPLLVGSTREEAAGLGDDPNAPLDAAGYAAAVHAEFDPLGAGVADTVLSLYPVTAYDSPAYALIAVDSDSSVTCPIRDVARAATGESRPPVWRYFYIHRFENDASLAAFRAFHTAELYFVFGNLQVINSAYTPTTAEVAFADQMIGYWTRFADTGDPNGSGATQWLRYDPTTDTMLQLDDVQTVINGYHNTQCDYFSTFPSVQP